MTLQNQLTAAPLAFDPSLSADIVARFEDTSKTLQDLVSGMAGSSSYLRGLLTREADWFASILDLDPDAAFEGILENIEAPSA